MFKTYQTKIKNKAIVLKNKESIPLYQFFEETARTFGTIERRLFVDMYVRKMPENELKVSYCAKHQITARQFNSIKKQLKGRISSKNELKNLYIEETKIKIQNTSDIIKKKVKQKDKAHISLLKMKGNEKKFLKKVRSYRKLRNALHQKKRKLYALTHKLEKLESDLEQKVVRICFGSKDWFHKQFNLKDNNLTFQEWKKEWQARRAAQFTFVGSKDETYGNQSCTYDLNNDLRIRVYTKDEPMYGNYVVIPNVMFSYGQEQIDKAKIASIGYTKGKGNKAKYYKASTWKFIRKCDTWYVNASVEVESPQKTTLDHVGSVGIDFNAGFLSITDVDRFGNYLQSLEVRYANHHTTSEQIEHSLSEALKVAVNYAKEKQKPIGHENLNFNKKKLALKQLSSEQAKLLSGFAYSTYQSLLKDKCEAAGVRLIGVCPAFTSQIGHHKFMKKYGLNSHSSAAMVIARRSLKINKIERMPVKHLLTGNSCKIVQISRWKQWKELTKQWKKYTFESKIYLLNQL
jgi:IS605 OrfB family transposase